MPGDDSHPVLHTFESFWGELLLVRFHGDGEAFREFNVRRATWLLAQVDGDRPAEGLRVLDLGCGSGVLDLVLAERGAVVTGVDRIVPVIDRAQELARQRGIAGNVSFQVADLRTLEFSGASFDLILLLGLVGLMSRADDATLIARARPWLRPGGRMIVDCPVEPAAPDAMSNVWTREMEGGVLEFRSNYDPDTRIQHLDPVFRTAHGEVLKLHDPYDPAKPGGICTHRTSSRRCYATQDSACGKSPTCRQTITSPL